MSEGVYGHDFDRRDGKCKNCGINKNNHYRIECKEIIKANEDAAVRNNAFATHQWRVSPLPTVDNKYLSVVCNVCGLQYSYDDGGYYGSASETDVFWHNDRNKLSCDELIIKGIIE
jgi:hypothetical protein